VALDAFLKLGDIAGASTDKVHKGEIEVESYTFGIANTATVGSATGGAGAGKATFSDFTFTSAISAASPKILLACAQGSHYPSAVLSVRKAGGAGTAPTIDFLKITLSEVFVTEYQDAASAGDEVPQEIVNLAFGAIRVEFTPQDPTGKPGTKVTGGWDRRTNQPAE
jgi:type VI secretion system secreted protein Hcp